MASLHNNMKVTKTVVYSTLTSLSCGNLWYISKCYPILNDFLYFAWFSTVPIWAFWFFSFGIILGIMSQRSHTQEWDWFDIFTVKTSYGPVVIVMEGPSHMYPFLVTPSAVAEVSFPSGNVERRLENCVVYLHGNLL